MKKNLAFHWPFLLCWIIAFCCFLCIGGHYGVAWDEHFQWVLGNQNVDYILKGDRTLFDNLDKDHGAGVELVLTGVERALGLTDYHEVYLMRHYLSHFFFLVSMACGYVLAWRLFKNRWLALLAFLMLLLQPRIYAHSFFNTKDVPLLNTFIIGFMLSEYAFRRDRNIGYILLGLVCGFGISIRLTGIILPVCIGAFVCMDLIVAIRNKQGIGKKVSHLVLLVLFTCLSLYLCWPTLWEHPVEQLVSSWKTLTRFRWESKVLLNGRQYIATDLPWFYLPEWFVITMPALWLLAGLVGTILLLIQCISRLPLLLANTPARNFLLYFLCFVLPVLSVLLLHPVIYDDWRHFYFIYPAFVMLALYAVSKIPQKKGALIAGSLLGVQTLIVIVFMIMGHPFQHVYFNELISHDDEYLRRNFELDYWGVSSKQALEAILAQDTSALVHIMDSSTPVSDNIMFLPADQRKRVFTGDPQPMYFITQFRYHPQDFEHPNIFWNKKILGSSAVRVYKLR